METDTITESRSPVDIYPFQVPQPILPGRLRIQVHSCFLNVPVKRPYVILTMGDQKYQTSISEYPQGRWHESFEFSVSFHAQLFDTMQMDLYDANLLLPDRHVGRAEIRIRNLEGMPEMFTSYYEIWEKCLSTGASSRVGRLKTMATNVGAIQAKIWYIYQTMSSPEKHSLSPVSGSGDREMKLQPSPNPALNPSRTKRGHGLTDEQLAAEFLHHVKCQRERSSADILFRKYEEGREDNIALPDGLDYPDESDSDGDSRHILRAASQHKKTLSNDHSAIPAPQKTPESTATSISNTMSSWFGFASQPKRSVSSSTETPSHPIQKVATSQSDEGPPRDTRVQTEHINILDDEEDTLKSYPILDTIGSWTVNKETNQVLRAIGKLLAAFGQGFELSNLQILSGFTVLEKFYNELPRDRTWDVVEDLSEIELAAYFWKYSVASYGWKGLNFIGKGNGYFSDAMRDHSDALSIMEYLSLPKQDLLAYEFRLAEAFRPSYFIARDKTHNAIVLSIRGTMSAFDTMTDLVCEYEQWRGGLVHKGMKSAATWFFRHVGPKLVAYTNEHSTTALYITGHSLGAATAAILTIMLLDFIDEFRKDKDAPFTLRCFGYAPACGMSLDLSERYKDYIHSIVFADDVVSKLSYGSMMNVKELIIAGAEAAKNLGVGQLWWTGKPKGDQWKAAFASIAESRRRCLESQDNPRLYVAGTVYQFWLDPAPHNDTRIVIERTDAKRVSGEVIVKRSIILDHLPTSFDLAFQRAQEALMQQQDTLESELDSDKHKPSVVNAAVLALEEAALKRTSQRAGGQGHALEEEVVR